MRQNLHQCGLSVRSLGHSGVESGFPEPTLRRVGEQMRSSAARRNGGFRRSECDADRSRPHAQGVFAILCVIGACASPVMALFTAMVYFSKELLGRFCRLLLSESSEIFCTSASASKRHDAMSGDASEVGILHVVSGSFLEHISFFDKQAVDLHTHSIDSSHDGKLHRGRRNHARSCILNVHIAKQHLTSANHCCAEYERIQHSPIAHPGRFAEQLVTAFNWFSAKHRRAGPAQMRERDPRQDFASNQLWHKLTLERLVLAAAYKARTTVELLLGKCSRATCRGHPFGGLARNQIGKAKATKFVWGPCPKEAQIREPPDVVPNEVVAWAAGVHGRRPFGEKFAKSFDFANKRVDFFFGCDLRRHCCPDYTRLAFANPSRGAGV